ncbi:MgtC/SapB family protein [Candidatus Woesearchaeota archaeon]|nr:MgtC/SapB family protein [Candidatus Woesearchaeota archaeon]
MVPVENIQLLYKFFLSIALGALIGIEREKSQQGHKGTDFAGVRTFMMITFFGTLSAYMSSLYFDWLLPVILVCFSVMIMAGYILSSWMNKEVGMTTELSAIVSYVIGITIFTATQEIPILLTIVVTLILSFKTPLHQFVHNLKSNEFFDTIKFLLIAFVILPLLKPIDSFGPFDSINLYEIWLMVVFVSGLSYIGYVLIKLFGSGRGTILTGFLGGILSSTAVVSSLANKTQEEHGDIVPYVAAAAIASSTMFIRILIEVSILNLGMIEKLAFPMILLALAGYFSISVLWRKKHPGDAHLEFKSPLMLKPALKFGFFYGLILIISNISNVYFGNRGVLIAALISGIADVDAITIFVARHSELSAGVGITAIILASTVNTFVKLFIAKFFGKKEFGDHLMKLLVPIIVLGLILTILL